MPTKSFEVVKYNDDTITRGGLRMSVTYPT
jgi:hypothetical protein